MKIRYYHGKSASDNQGPDLSAGDIIVCNKCGKVMDLIDKNAGLCYDGVMPYGSSYDGTPIRLDLCIECFDNLLHSCKLPPTSGAVDSAD